MLLISLFAVPDSSKQESRAVARKSRDAACYLFHMEFRDDRLGADRRFFATRQQRFQANVRVIIFKKLKLSDHGAPMSQTDRQTDGRLTIAKPSILQ